MPVKKGKGCVADVMREWKAGTLHSGEKGKVVKDQKQAVAIALSMCGASKQQAKSYEEYALGLVTEMKDSYAERGCKRQAMAIGYPTPTFSEEDTRMAFAQLRKLQADTSHLIMMMESEMMAGRMPEIEAWMEAKITLAADYMSAVHDYAMYGPGLEVEEEDEEEEPEGYSAFNRFGYAEGKG